ncbi:MAG: type III pantothenate kinase [Desulfobacteraceae bacterium]|nr:type III pantothenate kinase [Desulfobacteraceae bacterium]
MLLVIDVGNTNTVIGIFKESVLIEDWRIKTIRDTTADEVNVLIKALFSDSEVINKKDIKKVLISSVVPPAVPILNAFCKKHLNLVPIWITPDLVRSLMPVLYKNPDEVGADRIVNSIAAYRKYKTSLIVVDFGTATTFDVISAKGEYIGGAISPGIAISSEALFQKASRLPRVEIFQPTDKVIGRDTIESIKSGIIYGYASLVDGMVERMKKEMNFLPVIIATGGLSPLISSVSEKIDHVEESLTLDGLRIISQEL